MKKATKTLIAIACVATLSAGVCAMTACGGDGSKTGEAYSIVHNGSSVGYASVTVDKDGKLTKVVLEDACFPTQVKTEDGAAYAKVTYGSVTLLYDEDAKTYKVGEQTFGEYLKTAANAKAYYNAVVNNEISAYATADGTANKTAMTKNTLLKGQEGCTYWATPSAKQKMNYKDNRDATVAYVLQYGVEGLDGLTWSETKTEDGKEIKYWVKGEVSTGATWTDLYGTNADNLTTEVNQAKGAITYAKLIQNAYAQVK